jgi:hypothetical protein
MDKAEFEKLHTDDVNKWFEAIKGFVTSKDKVELMPLLGALALHIYVLSQEAITLSKDPIMTDHFYDHVIGLLEATKKDIELAYKAKN